MKWLRYMAIAEGASDKGWHEIDAGEDEGKAGNGPTLNMVEISYPWPNVDKVAAFLLVDFSVPKAELTLTTEEEEATDILRSPKEGG